MQIGKSIRPPHPNLKQVLQIAGAVNDPENEYFGLLEFVKKVDAWETLQ
jgi:hypothetical protein